MSDQAAPKGGWGRRLVGGVRKAAASQRRPDYEGQARQRIGDRTILGRIVMGYAGSSTTHIHSAPPNGVVLTVTPDVLFFDRTFKGKVSLPLFQVPVEELAAVAVEPWSSERSEYGWRPTTGFLHGATKIAAVSALVLTRKNGEKLLFTVQGPPVAATVQLDALLKVVPR